MDGITPLDDKTTKVFRIINGKRIMFRKKLTKPEAMYVLGLIDLFSGHPLSGSQALVAQGLHAIEEERRNELEDMVKSRLISRGMLSEKIAPPENPDFKGVYKDKNYDLWVASIRVGKMNGVRLYRGPSQKEAVYARLHGQKRTGVSCVDDRQKEAFCADLDEKSKKEIERLADFRIDHYLNEEQDEGI